MRKHARAPFYVGCTYTTRRLVRFLSSLLQYSILVRQVYSCPSSIIATILTSGELLLLCDLSIYVDSTACKPDLTAGQSAQWEKVGVEQKMRSLTSGTYIQQ